MREVRTVTEVRHIWTWACRKGGGREPKNGIIRTTSVSMHRNHPWQKFCVRKPARRWREVKRPIPHTLEGRGREGGREEGGRREEGAGREGGRE